MTTAGGKEKKLIVKWGWCGEKFFSSELKCIITLRLHIGLSFSLAEGNKVAWIRDYQRFLRLVLPKKDVVKMKGGGWEGRVGKE